MMPFVAALLTNQVSALGAKTCTLQMPFVAALLTNQVSALGAETCALQTPFVGETLRFVSEGVR